uniref:Uncharacterized protein n=1 Tax=viral metagenome TaxID=1070528 RepID=A0A6M3K7H6_9ZZZZ
MQIENFDGLKTKKEYENHQSLLDEFLPALKDPKTKKITVWPNRAIPKKRRK